MSASLSSLNLRLTQDPDGLYRDIYSKIRLESAAYRWDFMSRLMESKQQVDREALLLEIRTRPANSGAMPTLDANDLAISIFALTHLFQTGPVVPWARSAEVLRNDPKQHDSKFYNHRWLNHLMPGLVFDPMSEPEEKLARYLLSVCKQLHLKQPYAVTAYMLHRAPNEIKNFFYSTATKKYFSQPLSSEFPAYTLQHHYSQAGIISLCRELKTKFTLEVEGIARFICGSVEFVQQCLATSNPEQERPQPPATQVDCKKPAPKPRRGRKPQQQELAVSDASSVQSASANTLANTAVEENVNYFSVLPFGSGPVHHPGASQASFPTFSNLAYPPVAPNYGASFINPMVPNYGASFINPMASNDTTSFIDPIAEFSSGLGSCSTVDSPLSTSNEWESTPNLVRGTSGPAFADFCLKDDDVRFNSNSELPASIVANFAPSSFWNVPPCELPQQMNRTSNPLEIIGNINNPTGLPEMPCSPSQNSVPTNLMPNHETFQIGLQQPGQTHTEPLDMCYAVLQRLGHSLPKTEMNKIAANFLLQLTQVDPTKGGESQGPLLIPPTSLLPLPGTLGLPTAAPDYSSPPRSTAYPPSPVLMRSPSIGLHQQLPHEGPGSYSFALHNPAHLHAPVSPSDFSGSDSDSDSLPGKCRRRDVHEDNRGKRKKGNLGAIEPPIVDADLELLFPDEWSGSDVFGVEQNALLPSNHDLFFDNTFQASAEFPQNQY